MQQRFFCSLGPSNSGISESIHNMPKKNKLGLPLTISCLDAQEAEEIMKLQAFFGNLDLSKPPTVICREIAASAEIKATLPTAKFYPVLFGKNSAIIYRKRGDFQALRNSSSDHMIQTLRESMIYVILRGSEPLFQAILSSTVAKVAAPVSSSSSPAAHDVTGIITASEGIFSDSLYKESLDRALNKFGFEADSAPLQLLSAWPERSSQRQSSAVTASPTNAPVATPFIYSHIRNLSGIVTSLKQQPAPEDTPLPFLGSLVMAYLRAHGYDVPSVLRVSAAFFTASDPEEFATILAYKGLALAEGEFLWHLIDFCRSEIMQAQ